MACTPPLCNGTGSWCGCNCQCCPPPGCCTGVTQTWECGTTSGAWEGPPPNNGCDCIDQTASQLMWAGLNLAEGEIEIPFPNFNFGMVQDEPEEDGGFVWALQGCSIPCASVSVSISTTGCCLQVSGNSITVVGSGTVSASAGSGPGDCGAITVYVNGSPGSAALNNCDGVTISLSPANGACCSCCLVNTTCSGTLFAPIILRQQNIQAGTNKVYLNKRNLLERIRNLRRRKR
jgi:hypothetical protein